MQGSEGPVAHRAVADISMRMVVRVERYAHAGQLMDDVAEALEGILAGREGKFDFVGIQTRPCKDAQMARAAAGLVDRSDFLEHAHGGPIDPGDPERVW